jgi:hypothetical protein
VHTHKGTRWVGVPTELDELWFPHLEFASGHAEGAVTLLFEGGSKPSNPEFDGLRFYLLEFTNVQMVSAFAESMYQALAEEPPGSGCMISEIANSRLLPELQSVLSGTLKHFLVASGGMQCEVIASPDFGLRRFVSREAALSAAREDFEHKARNLEASSPEALELLRSLGVRT